MNKIIQSIRKLTDHVIVGVSCGKDSVVTLDLCAEAFPRVSMFFMYLVRGLSFQERYLEYLEARYGGRVLRIPHFQLPEMLKLSVFRSDTVRGVNLPTLKINDIEAHVRLETGGHWIAYGQKVHDSLERRARLKRCGGIEFSAGRFFPIADFSKAMVFNYLETKGIQLAPDYKYWGRSFGRLWSKELIGIKIHYPEDYQKILEVFPHAEAVVKRSEFGNNEISEIQKADDLAGKHKKRRIQSASH